MTINVLKFIYMNNIMKKYILDTNLYILNYLFMDKFLGHRLYSDCCKHMIIDNRYK